MHLPLIKAVYFTNYDSLLLQVCEYSWDPRGTPIVCLHRYFCELKKKKKKALNSANIILKM